MSDLPPLVVPYRAAALVHGGLAGMIVLVAWLTGGALPKALAFAVAYFVLATGWSWLRFRQRERRAAQPTPERGDNG